MRENKEININKYEKQMNTYTLARTILYPITVPIKVSLARKVFQKYPMSIVNRTISLEVSGSTKEIEAHREKIFLVLAEIERINRIENILKTHFII